MIDKILEKWFGIKQKIRHKKLSIFLKEGQICMCYLGENVGFERNGGRNFLRPVLVLKIISPNCALYLPLTTQAPKKYFKEKRFKLDEFFKKPSFVILDEIQTLDKRRFLKKMITLPDSVFWHIKNKCFELLKN